MDQFKRFVSFAVGAMLLIAGVAMILSWWGPVVIVVKGVAGIIFAVAGLVILYYLKIK